MVKISVDTEGAAGSATGSGTGETRLHGTIEAVKVDYHTSAPATTDVTITLGGDVPIVIGNLADTKTDVIFHPAIELADNTGTGLTQYSKPFADWVPVTVAVAGCDELTAAVVVTIITS